MKKLFTFLALILSIGSHAQNYVEFTNTEHTYSQDFNTLESLENTKNIVWTNGTVPLPGWYAYTLMKTTPTEVIKYSTGTLAVGGSAGVISFGTTSDRSLGAGIANAVGDMAYGVKIKNNTSNIIKSLKITYAGEQWTIANPFSQSLGVAYKLNATSLTDTDFSAIKELTFNCPIFTAGVNTSTRIDGNLPANRISNITYDLNVNIPVGEDIWLRWYDKNDPSKSSGDSINSGVDHQLAIDDLTVSATLATGVSTLLENQLKLFVASGILNVSGKSELSEIHIYSITGELIKQKKLYSRTSEVSVHELLNGIYIARVRVKDGHEIVKKFIK